MQTVVQNLISNIVKKSFVYCMEIPKANLQQFPLIIAIHNSIQLFPFAEME